MGAIWTAVKRDLFAGTLVLAPLGITIWVFWTLVGLADGLLRLLPAHLQPQAILGVHVPGLGVLLTVVVVAVVGMAMRYYAGRRIVEAYERLLQKVPLLSGVYVGFKQLFETIFSQDGRNFREVVVLEYPRPGIWSLGFVTSDRPVIAAPDGSALTSVFVPTTPNPTSGFYLLVSRAELRPAGLSVEEAFKAIMSAGIVLPDRPPPPPPPPPE
jgi:uncharacterized membrane protein